MSLFTQPKSQSATITTPGNLLLRLNETRHVGVFGSVVLMRYLCPALDALPADQRANLFAILQEAERATVDVTPCFGRLDLNGEDSGSDGASLDDDDDDDDDGLVDPSKTTSMQLAGGKRRIEALIAADGPQKVSTSEFDKEVISWLQILWHIGVEGATSIGEVLAALQLCDAIRYVGTDRIGSLPLPHGFTTSPRCSDSLNCSIVNVKRVSVYSNFGNLPEHVGWIRRELLLKKASSGGISRVLPVLSELRGNDLQRVGRWLPGSTVIDGKCLFRLLFPSCDEFVVHL